ncbi:hypothetical protein ACHAQJ_010299 [Trichoderma viride]
MRLINVHTSKLEEYLDYKAPPYAILSHTWGNDRDELSFRDVEDGNINEASLGSVKFRGCCRQAKKDGLDYAWIDTCCIDKTNLVELSEAINSMFRWYRRAKICYAYLSDVPGDENPKMQGSKFQTSRWFQRGWTLQELLAPKILRFYSLEWCYLGTKGSTCASITKATGIPRQYLLGIAALNNASVAQRMSWAAHRDTKRKEDLAYCLLGIFDITMPMIYGEGGDQAFFRLQEQIMKTTRDDSLLAWGIEMDEQLAGDSSQVSAGKILAAAPSDFANSGNIVRHERSLTFAGSVNMSGGSLQAYLSLLTTPAGKIVGLLNCGPESSPKQVIGIPLIKLAVGSSDEYARPRGSTSVLQPAAIAGTVPISIQIKHNSQKDVATDLNQLYYHYEDDEFAEKQLSLVDVMPESCWDKERALIMSTAKANDDPLGQILIRLRHDEEGSQDFVIVLDFSKQSSTTETQCCVLICNRKSLLKELATNLPSIMDILHGKIRASNGYLRLRVTLERVERHPIFIIRPERVPDEVFTTIDATTELDKRKLILDSMKILKESENIEHVEKEIKEREKPQLQYLKELKEERERVLLELTMLEEKERSLAQEEEKETQELYRLTEYRQKAEKLRTDVSRRWLLTQKQLEELQQVDGSRIDDVRDMTPLLWAAAKGHVEEVRQLLDEGVDIRASAKGDWKPIIAASSYGHVGVARLLLENGADIEDKGENSVTPLLAAIPGNCIDLIQLLLDQGANIEAAEANEGATALLGASALGAVNIARLLIERGANIEAMSNAGFTPLLAATSAGCIDLVELLLDGGAEMEVTNKSGITPLLAATTIERIDLVQLLLDKGANVEAVNQNGMTALMIAALKGNVAMAQILLATGKSNFDITDKRFGKDALDWAFENGDEAIVKLLFNAEKGG